MFFYFFLCHFISQHSNKTPTHSTTFHFNFHSFPFAPFHNFVIFFFCLILQRRISHFHLMRGGKIPFFKAFSIRLNLMVVVIDVLVVVSSFLSLYKFLENPFARFMIIFHRLMSNIFSHVSRLRI